MSFEIKKINRHRESTDVNQTGLYIHRKGDGSINSQAYTNMALQTRVMDDVIVPGFRQLSRAGYVIFNPCSFTVISEVASQGSYAAYYSSNGHLAYYSSGDGSYARFVHQTYGISVPSLSDLSDQLVSEAKSAAIANIDRTPYAFAEDVGELGETIRFLRNPAESLFSLSRSFRKARLLRERNLRKLLRRDAKRYWKAFRQDPRLQAVSDVWLSYRFALSPLLRSFTSLYEALNKSVKRQKRSSSHGRARGADKLSGTAQHLPFTWSYFTTGDIEVKASILYEVSSPTADFFYKYGLRLKDVPVTMWALMPYSFMVDRVVNLSNTIKGLTNLADPNVTILGATVTVKSNLFVKRELLSQTTAGYNITISDANITRNQYSYTRVVWVPGIGDTVARVNTRNLIRDAKSIADLLALVYKNLK